MNSQSLFSINYLGNLGNNDLKDVGSGFGYSFSAGDESGINGIFVSFDVQGFKLQIKSDMVTDGIIKFRKFNVSSSTWSNWISLVG